MYVDYDSGTIQIDIYNKPTDKLIKRIDIIKELDEHLSFDNFKCIYDM